MEKEFNAVSIIPSSGKYSKGTFAHPDIAFEFASWLSPEFKLYLITEFERLKITHTDAIKSNLIPTLTEKQKKYRYANEADVLNVALFGMTAKEWREKHPKLSKSGNIKDHADLLHLIILNNLETMTLL